MWLEEFGETLTKEPGLTKLAEYKIDAGEHTPIVQQTYNTTLTLISSVDKENDWLLAKGYIRESQSNWDSPIVTVCKPNGTARLQV